MTRSVRWLAPNLNWPPSKADLQHLYLEQQLSARRIAQIYGVGSQSTIFYHLRKAGIPSREPTPFRNLHEERAEEWVKRYQAGESLEQIAGEGIAARTVARYLQMRGLKPRTPGETSRIGRMKRDNGIFGEDEDEMKQWYVEEGLSCFQIGKRYGLSGNGSTISRFVRRRLRRMGVALRPRGSDLRKFDSLAGEWSRRYQAGESTVKIAKGVTTSTVVFRYLDELGIKHRNNSQNNTRYRKRPFDGTELDRAYMLGFTRGDVNVRRDYRLMKLSAGTTRGAQLDLFTSLFAPYGPVRVAPSVSRVAGFEWTSYASLDETFSFLLDQKLEDPSKIFEGDSLSGYLGGLFDAEGSLWLAADEWFHPFWSICNADHKMLDWVMRFLKGLGFHPKMSPPNSDGVARVVLQRRTEVVRLLQMLPIRHPEKKAKARLLLDQRLHAEEKRERWCDLLAEIEGDRNEMVRLSERELAGRGKGADSVRGMIVCLRYLSHRKKFPLDESIWLQTLNWLNEYVED